ncbi:MAG TPA: hypothetical protein VGM78_01035, partial [Ilumatobacteraceae bacterium]
MRIVFADPSAPVIVGAGLVTQHEDDPAVALEAGLLMRQALELAGRDSGAPAILADADAVFIPRGTWGYANPAEVVVPWKPGIRSVLADVGVLQQTLLNRACSMVASGAADVVLVVGGEAKHRALRGQISGEPAPERSTTGEPDERLVPTQDIVTPTEIARGLMVPARQFALIDTALRSARGLTPREHSQLLADLWSGFSAVAATNVHAWNRHPFAPEAISASPMLAWPYTKLLCSQWNVDQAVALIVCNAGTAARFGIAPERWVFAHAGVESNAMVPLTLRADMHRSPAVAAIGRAIRDAVGVDPRDFEQVDLYSCFPAAVRVQADELGLGTDRPLTVTGGMTFGGGPFNNSSLTSLATMIDHLRSRPADIGLVTNVSGMLTKFGASAWSCRPPAASARSTSAPRWPPRPRQRVSIRSTPARRAPSPTRSCSTTASRCRESSSVVQPTFGAA